MRKTNSTAIAAEVRGFNRRTRTSGYRDYPLHAEDFVALGRLRGGAGRRHRAGGGGVGTVGGWPTARELELAGFGGQLLAADQEQDGKAGPQAAVPAAVPPGGQVIRPAARSAKANETEQHP